MATAKDKLIASAQKLVEKNQFDKAIKEYLRVVADDDKDVRIWLKIGDLYAKIGQKAEAAETYQKVAQFYSDQGFYLKSVAVYKQILKIDPRLVQVNLRLAELYKQLGLVSDAMAQFEAVAAHYQADGKPREALAALKQIVELDPETVRNRIDLAEQYSKHGMVREAIEEFSKAAEQLKEAGRNDEYMMVAERLLFHSPDNRPVSKDLARLYVEKGDPRRALPKLQQCFKADSRDTETLSLLAQAFDALDQRAKAVSVLKELARIHGENGDAAGRAEAYRKILDLEPNDAEAEAALANLRRAAVPSGIPQSPMVGVGTATSPFGVKAMDDHDPPSFSSSGHTATRNPPSQPDVNGGLQIDKLLNETDVYIKYKLYTKAIEHVQRVFELAPQHVGAREKLKALYLTVGKRDEAVLELWSLAEDAEPGRQRRYLREILEIDPSNSRAASMLGVDQQSADPGDPGDPSDDEQTGQIGFEDDDDGVQELSSDEFDVSEPSAVRPYHDLGEEDSLIPVVVEPLGSGDDELLAAEVPVEDRFGFGDEDAVLPANPPARAPSPKRSDDDDHDLHTRADDRFRGLVPPPEAPLPDSHDDGLLVPTPVPGRVAVPVAAAPPPDRPESSLEDDLDESEFFMQQSLFDEARAMLESLAARYPSHPLVAAKLRDLDAQERAAAPEPLPPVQVPHADDAHQQLAAEPPDELPGIVEATAVAQEPFEITRSRGVIEKGVTAEDFETHYDLGIAYKEMGLLDDAIAEFKTVMKDPPREVQCHLMIGLCFLEKGQQGEAIAQFKKGLYVEGITDRETLSLYFELGQGYERMGDPREALYYYEKVQKRDARFRNVERYIAALRGGPPVQNANPAGGEDMDSVFDGLVGDDG